MFSKSTLCRNEKWSCAKKTASHMTPFSTASRILTGTLKVSTSRRREQREGEKEARHALSDAVIPSIDDAVRRLTTGSFWITFEFWAESKLGKVFRESLRVKQTLSVGSITDKEKMSLRVPNKDPIRKVQTVDSLPLPSRIIQIILQTATL